MKLAAALLLVAACDAQVDGTYAGEAYVRLRGVAVAFDADVAIDGAMARWTSQSGAQLDAGPTTPLPLEWSPPALAVPVVSLPPDDARFGFAGEPARIAEATLFVTHGDKVVGEALDIALVYVDADVAAGSMAANYLGGAVASGFHLRDVRPTANLTPAQADLALRCGDTAACEQPRLYRLVPIPDDLAAELQFFQGGL
jgi:hypothetical protein